MVVRADMRQGKFMVSSRREQLAPKPLVSILISAYNAQEWVAETLQSAVNQSWDRKEIILVDDGSTDRTAEVARRFQSKGVTVVSGENRGLSAGQNTAYRQCQGDYIQYLDADDLLASDKIERQLAALREDDSKRLLLSSPWAPFYYRTKHARFVHNSLCEDLSPVEWLLRKLKDNVHMQNATWLVSRELAEAAGLWDVSLNYDQDGEYFARVLLASEGTRFVPGTGIFYRMTSTNRVSYLGKSNNKKDSLIRSMKLHIQYLRSLEDSERVRNASLAYIHTWLPAFYPDRPDIICELEHIAAEFDGSLARPSLNPKYAWMESVLGWNAANWTQQTLSLVKSSLIRRCDKALFMLDELHPSV